MASSILYALIVIAVTFPSAFGTSVPKVIDLDLKKNDSDKTVINLGLSNATRNERSLIHDKILPFVVQQLGLIECQGLDHATGGNFFENIMGKGADFGGDYLCQPTCGGECIPTQGLGEAPVSIYYPFGCRCAPNRCDAHGPIVTDLIKPIFKISCVKDDRCTCNSMRQFGPHIGYLCNWINLNTQKVVGFLEKPFFSGYPPSYSPIRWCSCCPAPGVF